MGMPIIFVVLPLALSYLSMKTIPQGVFLVILVAHLGLSGFNGYRKIGKCIVFLLFPLSMAIVITFVCLQLFEPALSDRPVMPIASTFLGILGGMVSGVLIGVLYFKWIRMGTKSENWWITLLAAILFLVLMADKVLEIV